MWVWSPWLSLVVSPGFHWPGYSIQVSLSQALHSVKYITNGTCLSNHPLMQSRFRHISKKACHSSLVVLARLCALSFSWFFNPVQNKHLASCSDCSSIQVSDDVHLLARGRGESWATCHNLYQDHSESMTLLCVPLPLFLCIMSLMTMFLEVENSCFWQPHAYLSVDQYQG